MPRAKAQSKGKGLIASMDRFAAALLKQAEVAEGLADKIAVGSMVSKWIGIRHRVEDGDDQEGALLDGLKFKMRGGDVDGRAKPRGFIGRPELNALGGRVGAARRWGGPDPREIDDAGGPALEALKAKLPSRPRP
jgi:hypothetical protein